MPPLASDHDSRITRTRLALDGLSIGDAFGERFMHNPAAYYFLKERALPGPPWQWTDDTAMAVAITAVLNVCRGIEQDALAKLFARRYSDDPMRGYAGGIAVAIAAAHLCDLAAESKPFDRAAYFDAITRYTPPGPTAAGIAAAASLDFDTELADARAQLGNGSEVTAMDTVPLCLWLAARHHDSFEDAMWNTVACGGDVDTTAAIVGGLVACSVGRPGIPPAWLACREPLS